MNIIPLLVPDDYVFLGSEGHKRTHLILHKTAGFHTAQEVAAYFQRGSDGRHVSSHYVVGLDGTVVQCVREQDGAGANGVLEPGHDPWWSENLNPNLITFSVEHVDPAQDNSTPLTTAQKQASFALIKDICTRRSIPLRPADAIGGITGHYSIDPQSRHNCPGNYPWDELWAYLKGAPSVVTLSKTGEVADFQEADQFQSGKSQFECGYFACAMARSLAQVGHPPTLTMQQVINNAESWYAQYNGSDDISNLNGMTLQQEYDLLHQIGLHYQGLDLDIANSKAWLHVGYPVLVAITETSVFDIALGGNPYTSWTPAGTHVILLTGIASDGNLLVRDSANCTNLNDPNSLRPGPRHYDAARLQLVSATVAVPPWLPRPTSPIAPKEITMIPQGWHDDGTKLVASNGHYFVRGFRQHVLDASFWEADDVPLEEEQQVPQVEQHTNRGAGVRQLTNSRLLVWTSAMGVKESACGAEIAKCYNVISTLEQQLKAANAEIATLKATTPPASGAIGAAITPLQALIASATLLEQEVAQAMDTQKVTVQHVIDVLHGK